MGYNHFWLQRNFRKKKHYYPRISHSLSNRKLYITIMLGRHIWREVLIFGDLFFKKFHAEIERTNKLYIYEDLTHIYPLKELFRKKAPYKIFDQKFNRQNWRSLNKKYSLDKRNQLLSRISNSLFQIQLNNKLTPILYR